MTTVKLLRRIHMYLALLLAPWMLMYGLSGIVMSHRPLFNKLYDGKMHEMQVERELDYEGVFSEDATPKQMGRQILIDMDMDGPFGQRAQWKDGALHQLTVWRSNPVMPRELVYTPADGKLVIKKRVFKTPQFLVGVHHHQGFRQDYGSADAWAVVLDLVIVAMLLWCITGVWIWVKMPAARRWGAIGLVAGVGMFAMFLCTI